MFLIGLLLKVVMTASRRIVPSLSTVMPGFMPGIHVFAAFKTSKTWMAGTSPAMTLRVNPAMTFFWCVVSDLSSVMPGFVPGIHVFAALQRRRRGWPEQVRP